jgi:hypothetical protein
MYKSTQGFGITMRWIRVMMMIDAKASMIQAAALIDSFCEFPL